jgi:hypothetical protein
MSNDKTKIFANASITAKDETTKAPTDVSSEKQLLEDQKNMRRQETGTIRKALDDDEGWSAWGSMGPPELHNP